MSDKDSARVLLSLKKNLLDEVDKRADNAGQTRSEFVRQALRFYIKNGTHFNLNAEQVHAEVE